MGFDIRAIPFYISMIYAIWMEFWTLTKILTPKLKFYTTCIIGFIMHAVVYFITTLFSPFFELVPEVDTQRNIRSVGLLLTMIVFIAFLFKDNAIEKLKAGALFQICVLVYEGILVTVYTSVLGISFEEQAFELSLGEQIIYAICCIGTYSLLSLTLRFVFKKIKVRVPVSVMATLTIIIVMNCLMMMFIYSSNYANKDTFTTIVLYLVPAAIIIMCIALYKIMVRVNDNEVLREKLYWLESVKGIELDYYNKLQDKTNDMRRIRHDFKGVIDSINLLISENTPESLAKAKELLTSLNNSLNLTKIPVYSRNLIANAVIAAKDEEAKNEQIEMNIAVDIPEEISVEAIDLNCVFLNMLNNAIESCKKLPVEQRKIILKATVQAGYLMIKTENPYLSIETDKQGKIKTSKKDTENHGFGLSLIEDISKKYDGHFQVDTTNGNFITTVSLEL
ncbi:MAG: GHKL domain-containing protein [Clostridia bacterium]|nr:GHKL domain-containing protein [Clostridia bacterium]